VLFCVVRCVCFVLCFVFLEDAGLLFGRKYEWRKVFLSRAKSPMCIYMCVYIYIYINVNVNVNINVTVNMKYEII
jgi:hypothetical protein